MEDHVFKTWLKDVFLKYIVDQPKPIVVFFNDHVSHITFDTTCKAKEASSSTLYPMDVGVSGPAKKVWYQIWQKFYRESRQQSVSKPAFPSLLKELYTEAVIKQLDNIIWFQKIWSMFTA